MRVMQHTLCAAQLLRYSTHCALWRATDVVEKGDSVSGAHERRMNDAEAVMSQTLRRR